MPIRHDLRNVAIVAHVDHGKTTLVDAMLWQSGAFRVGQDVEKRVMDSMDLEREKGITILAKNTAVLHHASRTAQTLTINIIDTPGHADFGGEVERGLEMVDGVLLLVDASEGPLPQTRFVLRKALAKKLPIIVVVNKVDRPDARIAEVVEETYELFLDLLDDDETHVLDFPVVYASAKAGRASLTAAGERRDARRRRPRRRCSQTILEHIPAPTYTEGAVLQAHVTNLDASPYLGRLALCRIVAGTMKRNQLVAWCRSDGTIKTVKLSEMLITEALDRVPADSAGPGDIVAIAGIPDITIGETLSDPGEPQAAAADHRRRAVHLDDDRHQHLAAGRQVRQEPHGPAGQGPARRRAGRQRVHPGAPHRAARHLGGPGPRRAAAGHPGRDDAPRGLRADRRQAAGRHPGDRRQDARAGRAADHRRRRRTSSAWSPSCWGCAAAGWSRWSTTAPAGSGWSTWCRPAA